MTQPHLTVFGATRGIGESVARQALDAGHPVTVLVRDPSRLTLRHPGLTVVQGDATNPPDVRRAIAEADAVVVALGAPALSDSRIRSEGTRVIAEAMEERGLRRLVAVSVLGLGDGRDSLPFFLRYVIFPTYLRRPVAEHAAQEAILEASDLDWTAVRPPNLTDGPRTGRYVHGFGADFSGVRMDVSREDVADFILRQVGSDAYVGRAVEIANAA